MDISHIDNWIFDLDNTLYSGDTQFFSQIDKKITAYISTFLSLNPVDARRIQKQYLYEYGTSLSGLMREHDMDPDDYLDYVHNIDVSSLTPDPALAEHLAKLPGRKFIFTNGSRAHAQKVGDHLEIYHLFDGVFGIEDGGYVPKPHRRPYDDLIAKFAIDPAQAFMAEDMARNLEIPKQMGMTTLLLASSADWSHEPARTRPHTGEAPPDFVDHVTYDLTDWLSRI
ncbi:MAG TPA: pyrimidine 5'-nucleotidase [Hellea balneolensis]|uniref:Pyrimidine 5'-nucleotidase n=1 Tax=Hellea balneolensis TaxID=287478 RepID=A0A7C3FXH6_9PROT|nr:pyrimidine 5'-nucleotidase [Hellea balneolensis]